jgi:hypothetical protein
MLRMPHRLCGLLVFFWTAILLSPPVDAQPQRASLSGIVRDADSGEPLALANVTLRGTSLGAATNAAGYYSIAGIQPGTYTAVFTFIGFREQLVEITLGVGENRRLDVDLAPGGVEIDEVVVTADAIEEREARSIGAARLSTETIRRLPTVFEPDVFRSLQFLPGVKSASDFSSGLYIRGGSPDQTLILLDRNTVYNPTHFFGFFSTFNPDAIRDVRLYKGNFPAEYGGRLGSVVDVYNKDGNRRRLDGTMSVGLLASRGLIEGPFKGGSYMLAVRRSTLEPLLAALNSQDIDGIPESFWFYDLNGKLNFDITRDDRLSVAFYGGSDNLELSLFDEASIDLVYGNRTIAATWTRLFSTRFFSNITFAGSQYFSRPEFFIAGTPFERRNLVDDYSVKADFEFVPDDRHRLKGGLWGGRFLFRLRESFDEELSLMERIPSLYAAAYLEDRFRFAPRFELQAGVRANYYEAGDHLRVEPRLSLEYQPSAVTRLQVGYGRYHQFLTLITSELFSGFDIWLTTGEGVPPSYGDQFGAGIKTVIPGGLNLDVEGYYRTMRGLFELDPFVPDVSGLEYAELFRFGSGYAYGLETFVERTRGRITGFAGYTYGITRRRFPNVNDNRFFAPKYDRTHDVDLVLNYRLSRGWQLTTAFTYGTGQAYTEPFGLYKLVDDPFGGTARSVLVSNYNNARLPPYHRLDAGFSRTGRFFGFADYELQLQVINVYSRRNIWFYFFEFEANEAPKRNEIPQIPIPLPNIALTIDF